MAQAVHGKYFSRRKWEEFLRSRPVPGGRVSFQEIEVMLCNIPDRVTLQREKQADEREKEGKSYISIIVLSAKELFSKGARCSSMVRAFTHGVMGRLIDPSWWTH